MKTEEFYLILSKMEDAKEQRRLLDQLIIAVGAGSEYIDDLGYGIDAVAKLFAANPETLDKIVLK